MLIIMDRLTFSRAIVDRTTALRSSIKQVLACFDVICETTGACEGM
jgi:hypothetical protein